MDDTLFLTENEMTDCYKEDDELGCRGPPKECRGDLLPPIQSRLEYIKNYNKTIMKASATQDKTEQVIQTLRPTLFHHKPPESLGLLQATMLQEVAQRVNFIHEDKILFLKTTHDAFRIIGTHILVEDDAGDCILLSLYHYVASHEDPTDVFPIGTHLALLAPLMKHGRDHPRHPLLLRCDNPECVRVFPCYKSWIAAKDGKQMLADVEDEPDTLRERGNQQFSKQKYEEASQLYTQALACTAKISESTRIACLSNRAQVNLRMQRWEAAERDAQAVLLLDPYHVKARFRLTRALLYMNRISEAHALVLQLKNEPDLEKNRELRELLLAVKQARAEQENGSYDLDKMVQEVSRQGSTSFHANYTSPKIEQGAVVVKTSGFTYRGCVARQFIPKQTLISASKAVAFVPRSNERIVSYGYNPYVRTVVETLRLDLENNVIVMLHRRPELKKMLYSLSSGVDNDSFSKPLDMRLDVDRVIRIIGTNSFSLDSESSDDKPAWRRILSRDGVANGRMITMSIGLWINESIFNHSCTPNCMWCVVGDHMFVRTTKDIQAGEELCFSYVNLDGTFDAREKTFSNWLGRGLGFCCQCDWCCVMRATPELRQADQVLEFAFKNSVLKFEPHENEAIAKAIDVLLPESVRAEYFELFSQYPLKIQHVMAAKLWLMEGIYMRGLKNDLHGYCHAMMRAAAIREAVYGISQQEK